MRKTDFVNILFKYKIVIILVVFVIFVASAIMMTSLTMDNDLVSFIAKDDPSIILLDYTGEKFGSNYMNLVALDMKDVFTYESLSLIQSLTEQLEAIEGVDQVISLTNVLDVKKLEDGIEVSRLLDGNNIPSDKASLEKLRNYVLTKEMFKGSIVNERGTIALMMVKLRTSADKDIISDKVDILVNKEIAGSEGIKAYFSGLPMWMHFANKLLVKDLMVLTPIVALLIIGTLLFSFRSFHGVILPFTTVVISTVFAIGMMHIFGMSLTIVSSIIPIILLSTGTAYGIHFLNRENELMAAGVNDPKERIKKVFERVGTAIILSAVTTMFGFSSLITANIIPVRQMGVVLAIGIFYALVITLTLIPILLDFWRRKMTRKKIKVQIAKERRITGGEKILKHVAHVTYKYPYIFLTLTALILVLSVIFIPSIRTEVNISKYFPPNTPIRKADLILQKEFSGSDPIVVYFKTEDIKNPAVLKLMQRIQKKMRATDHIGNPQGVTDYLMEMNFLINDQRLVPSNSMEIENLWLFIDGKKELKGILSEEKKEALVQGMVDSGSTSVISPLTKEVDTYLESLPKEYTTLDTEGLDDAQRSKVIDYYCSLIAEEMIDDLEFEGVKEIDLNKLSALIAESMKNLYAPPDYLKNSIGKYLTNYLSSDTCEIPFEDPRAVESITASIKEMSTWDEQKVHNLILKWTPRPILKDDPAAVDDLVFSLENKWIYAQNHAVVKYTLDNIKDKFSISTQDFTPISQERLEGDLWQIYDSQLWIPATVYKDIKNADPDEVVQIEVQQTGTSKMTANIMKKLVNSLVQSIILAIVLVLIVLSIQFRSFIGGIIAVIPIILTILTNFVIMSIFDIPLDVATMMFASIAVGIGIDYTIHIKVRLKKELNDHGNFKDALEKTTMTTGKAVMINTVAVMTGFIVLALSEFEPIRWFGYITSLTMIISAWAAITVFPVFLMAVKPKFFFNKSEKK